jgi:hypothetical protein
MERGPRRTNLVVLVAVAAALLSAGCRARGGPRTPRIEITTVPPADKGGPDLLDSIAGRVVGAQPGQRVVIFSKSRVWWVQPGARNPFTDIQADSTWQSPTHLGTEYAALLVDPAYRPPASNEVLPQEGEGIVAITVVEGDHSKRVVRPTLQFSGYEWLVRSAPSDRGGANDYDPSNAWTDGEGAMHLRIAGQAPNWTCAEVALTQRLGYGLYRFVVRDVAHLDPAAVLTFFTWDGPAADENHREMDIELSRWGSPAEKNARYLVQPYYILANMVRFDAPTGVLTHWLRWEPGRATFRTVRGAGADPRARAVAEHVFTSGVPAPGNEQVRMNLYAFRRGTKALERGGEVVIEKFEYAP